MKSFAGILIIICTLLQACGTGEKGVIMTVKGPIPSSKMDISLTHEHILVDFSGGDTLPEKKWVRADVVRKSLPFLLDVKERGCKTIMECTPVFLGRDPLLLKMLSDSSGLNILTNTGYYIIPGPIRNQSADQYAEKWISEWENGIDSTGIKPGFIKIRVDNGKLSGESQKIVIAAAMTHLKTGLTIVSHTGPAVPAFQEIEILLNEGVSPEAFIWVHAQSEKDRERHVEAARMGAWISFDGLNETNADEYVSIISNMKKNGVLDKVLISHDAGWYSPGEKDGGKYRGYTALFDILIPLLRKAEFSRAEIRQLLVKNPAEAFSIRVRRL